MYDPSEDITEELPGPQSEVIGPHWRQGDDPWWVIAICCLIALPFVIFVVVIVGVFIIGGIGFLFAHYTAAAVTTTFVLAMLGLGGFTLYKARQSR